MRSGAVPAEQQPRHPVGQHPGLARAGVGRHPARGGGRRRPDLRRDRRRHRHSPLRRVAVRPLALARQVVVVAVVALQPLRAQPRDVAAARPLVVGDQRARAASRSASWPPASASSASALQLPSPSSSRCAARPRRHALEAARFGDRRLERQLQVEGVGVPARRHRARLVVVDRVAAVRGAVDPVGAGGDGEGEGEAIHVAAAVAPRGRAAGPGRGGWPLRPGTIRRRDRAAPSRPRAPPARAPRRPARRGRSPHRSPARPRASPRRWRRRRHRARRG